MNDIKPCPFCGTKPRKKDVHDGWKILDTEKRRYVECPTCGARGPLDENKVRAVDAWNVRTQEVGP